MNELEVDENEIWQQELECVLCGETFVGGGHNAWPLAEESYFGEKENRCCEDCNYTVILMRMLRFQAADRNEVDPNC